jgi:hypothetical protein
MADVRAHSFWTLGGNQVGKGALSGWKEFLRPARELTTVHIWPFDGSFEELLGRAGRPEVHRGEGWILGRRP